MDVVANTIQTLGFAGQIFTGCLNGFEAWQAASDLSRDAIELQIKLEWTRSRLDMWGTLWGLEQQNHLNDSRFRHFGMMALNHLVYINYCLEEFKSMDDIFPTLAGAGRYASAPAVSLARLSKSGEVTQDEMDALRLKLEKLQNDSQAKERIKWALQDGRALKMVESVKDMVEDLYVQFPPPDSGANPMIKNNYLISDSLDSLDAVAESSNADPQLASLCLLKAENIRLGLKQRSDKLQSHDPFKIKGVLIEPKNETKKKRQTGLFRQDGVSYSTPVLIEYKRTPVAIQVASVVDERIKNVARLLCMDKKPIELRTLDCIGTEVTRITEENGSAYKFIYEMKAKKFFTLKECLPAATDLKNPPRDKWPLNQKFHLAQQLSRAVLYLHLAGWLHKGIRSDNIVFCADSESSVDLSEPYFVGFEYSRADLARNETATVPDTGDEDDAFRHPDTQGEPSERSPFHRIFDVYSLGMVLLDIGSQRTIDRLRKKFIKLNDAKGDWSASQFREWLLKDAIDSNETNLCARMGPVYVSVVKACLDGTFKSHYKDDLNVSFYLNVVRKLQQCNV